MTRDSARSLWWNRGPRMKAKQARARRLTAVAVGSVLTLGLAVAGDPGRTGDWRSYGGDPGGSRFSTLPDIDRGNVSRLQRAWTYHTGDLDTRPGAQPTAFESTPLAVDGVLYASTPSSRVIALDGDTGRELWRFDPPPRATDARSGAASTAAYRIGKPPIGPTAASCTARPTASSSPSTRAPGACGRISATAGGSICAPAVADAWPHASLGVTSPPGDLPRPGHHGHPPPGIPGPRGPPATSARTTCGRERWPGVSTPSRGRARRGTTPGRARAGKTAPA